MTQKRFEPIVRNVTISKTDMQRLLEMPLKEMDDWSPVNVRLFDGWRPAMEAMAVAMADQIRANNAQGKPTAFILPVGPVAQYPIAAEMSNREGVSWRNVWTSDMDEYLDWENRPIAEDHPMSFHGSMQENLFSRLDEALGIPETQRWFPDPFDPDAIDEKIVEVTDGRGVDICFGGIGEHGHIAFDEAADLMTHYTHITPEEFKNSKSRVLPHLNPETWARAFRNPLYTLCPPGAVTIGMQSILGAQRIMLSTAGVIAKIAAMHPPTVDYPVTFIQEHENPKETVTLLVTKRRWGE
jgi:glucosamine-6-phosphate deaminase